MSRSGTWATARRLRSPALSRAAIIKKRLDIDASLYTILLVLSVTVFEKTPFLQMISEAERREKSHPQHNQLNLFD